MIMEKHVFPGGNTSNGFHSFYDYMIDKETANKIFILKGGPGTGKSSLMKKVANYYLSKGYSIEYHHCSSDNNSLDGIVILELKLCILDGTSPHIVDPKYPGSVDEIINLGTCWDEENIKSSKKEIIELSKSIKEYFNRAYRFFKSAKSIYEDWENFNKNALNTAKLDNIISKLSFYFPIFNDTKNRGDERHLFATAFTPNGIITYVDTLYKEYTNITVLSGEPGLGKSTVLSSVAQAALKSGFDVEFYHNPLDPNKLEHIFIPKASMAILTSNELNKKSFNFSTIIMEDICNKDILIQNRVETIYDRLKFEELIKKGLDCIKEAKSLHDKLENYYVPSMDFKKIDQICNDIIDRFNKYDLKSLN
ncbi:PRK06851 family protein [Clostridium fallax]|uniref:Nephrocystin 3-like N-terminal domain-containing protein n=1 Tax=Clostridium fallax TaxID=1533 RepID=A0A1M4XQW6_9CLOT|nr:PRK06851 family protein [Clostridium fallax]SHE95642.1 hypothetical protein SAMN05443638_1209 [Clostridium fallax]SQB08085.1 ATPase [Clostridium fallax]